MPKIVTKRFRTHLSSIKPYSRQSTQSILLDEKIDDTKQQIGIIFDQLRNEFPSERALGTHMIMSYVTKKRYDQIESQQLAEVIRKLSQLILDRAENVRCGAIDALCHLSTLNEDIFRLMIECHVIESIIDFFDQYLVPLDFNKIGTKTKPVSSLITFIDGFHLLTSICDKFPSSITTNLSVKLNKIILKCIDDHDHDQSSLTICQKDDLNLLNLKISCLQFLMVILDENRKLLDLDKLQSSLNKMYGNLFKNYLENTQRPEYSAGLYLLFILFSIRYDYFMTKDTIHMELWKFEMLQQLSLLMDKEYLVKMDEENFKKLTSNMDEDMSSEMQSLLDLYPIQQQIKFRLLTRQFCFEWLTDLATTITDEDEEIMADEHNSLTEKFLMKKCSVDLILNEMAYFSDWSNQLNGHQHIYGKEILDLCNNYLIICLALLHNLSNTGQFNQSDIEKIWKTIHPIVFEDTNTSDKFSIRKEAVNVIRQICSSFSSIIELSLMELFVLKNLWCHNCLSNDDYVLNINITKIISDQLVKYYQKNPCQETMNNLSEWLLYLLNSFRFETNDQELILLNCEMFDSIIDALSDEAIAKKLLLNDKKSILLNSLSQSGKKLIEQISKCQTNNIKDSDPVIGTVMENLEPFLEYVQNI